MPPKGKGKASLARPASTEVSNDAVDATDEDVQGEGGIENFELPKAAVIRLAKASGPESMKLAKEVPIAITRASTIFINYLASMAHDIAVERGDKILSANHILEACKDLQWDDDDSVIRFLKSELDTFRKANTAKKDKVKEKQISKQQPNTKKDVTSPTHVIEDHLVTNPTLNRTTIATELVDADETESDEVIGRTGEEVEDEDDQQVIRSEANCMDVDED